MGKSAVTTPVAASVVREVPEVPKGTGYDSMYPYPVLPEIPTVDSLLTHTPRWTPKAMGYEGLLCQWVMRGNLNFWCKITIRWPQKAWVILVMDYGLSEVWVTAVGRPSRLYQLRV
jgi:hypothetical protein